MHAEDTTPGLAPSAARDWLDLQSALALFPESIGDSIRKGQPPTAILAKFRARRDPRSRRLDLGESSDNASDNASGRISDMTFASSSANTSDSTPGSVKRRRERLEALGIRVVPLSDAGYPAPLSQLTDSPLVLQVRGQVATLSSPAIAIVGARAATHAARATARRLARELAGFGLTIVSGLARGIDAEAHRGALEVRGRTIGVLACGLDQIYPPEHRKLAEEMLERGAVLSEMPLGVPPLRSYFPLRNRIISGLCLATIVVEARRRSGSLITVRHALAQGRDVFVVPGSIDGPFAEGTNQLLRDGARPIRSARDVIEDLGLADRTIRQVPATAEQAAADESTVGTLEDRVLAILAKGPVSRDELLSAADLDASGLARALLELELDGRIVEERDGRIHRVWS
jgi:DNA processing protein